MKVTYVKTQLQNVVNISKIVTVHYYEFDKNFVFNGESHDFWEMVYIDKGRVQVRNDEEELVLSQGEIIFHRPNEFHSIKALHSAPNFFVVSFVCTSPLMIYLEKYHTILNKTLHGFISSVIKEAENTYLIPKNDPALKQLIKKENARTIDKNLFGTVFNSFNSKHRKKRRTERLSIQRKHGKSSYSFRNSACAYNTPFNHLFPFFLAYSSNFNICLCHSIFFASPSSHTQHLSQRSKKRFALSSKPSLPSLK